MMRTGENQSGDSVRYLVIKNKWHGVTMISVHVIVDRTYEVINVIRRSQHTKVQQGVLGSFNLFISKWLIDACKGEVSVESFPYRLELKDRVAWFQCQEHMDKEIARYNKPKTTKYLQNVVQDYTTRAKTK